jgi:hypothetical protein
VSPAWLVTQSERKLPSAGRAAGRRLLVSTNSAMFSSRIWWPPLSERDTELDGWLVAALLAEQNTAEPGAGLLRFVPLRQREFTAAPPETSAPGSRSWAKCRQRRWQAAQSGCNAGEQRGEVEASTRVLQLVSGRRPGSRFRSGTTVRKGGQTRDYLVQVCGR